MLTQEDLDNFMQSCSDNDPLRIQLLIHKWTQSGAMNEFFPSDFIQSFTPLIAAVELNHMYAVEQLLIAGADPNIQNVNKDTALSLCVTSLSDKRDCAELLIQHGSDVNATNAHAENLLIKCVRGMSGFKGHYIDLLVNLG